MFSLQFPDSSPALPAELAELSFDDEDFDDEDDDDDDDDDEDDDDRDGEDEEERGESNRSEPSDDNEGVDIQNEEEEVTSATEDEEAGGDSTSLIRNGMLQLDGWCLDEIVGKDVFAYSVFYVFYEQYLTIVKDTWENLLYCAGQYNFSFLDLKLIKPSQFLSIKTFKN